MPKRRKRMQIIKSDAQMSKENWNKHKCSDAQTSKGNGNKHKCSDAQTSKEECKL